MKPTIQKICLHLCLLALSLPSLHAGPKFSRGTAVDGVVAYQDDADPSQFHYLPARIDLVLGKTLNDFNVAYWGVGKPFFFADNATGLRRSTFGAVVSGRATLDISDAQRTKLIAELKKTFNIANPKLLPLAMTNPVVSPVLAVNTLGFGKNSDVQLPTTPTFGGTFNFTIGTGNSLFAQFVATKVSGSDITPNSHFGVNIVGDVEFVSDPWKYEIEVDLSQVWKQVRQKYSASVSFGWFRIGSAEYQSIVQELIRNNTIKLKQIEGSLDNEKYGRQILEMGKKIFEKINSAVTNGEGFFKFEPNPQAGEISSASGGSGSWPWSVSLNGGYSSAHFTQQFTYREIVEYTGRLTHKVPCSMVLAVGCNSATGAHFSDLRDGSTCITQEKIDQLQARLAHEAQAKGAKIRRLEDKLINGDISPDDYAKRLAILVQFSEEDLGVIKESDITKSIHHFKAAIASDKILKGLPQGELLRTIGDILEP